MPCQHVKKWGLGGLLLRAGKERARVGGVGALVVWRKGTNTRNSIPRRLHHVITLKTSPRLAFAFATDREDNMSSLTGALESPDDKIHGTSADVDMHPSSFEDATPELEPKQEEEMGDLFGEDSNVDFVHHSRLVPPPS